MKHKTSQPVPKIERTDRPIVTCLLTLVTDNFWHRLVCFVFHIGFFCKG